MLRALLKFSKPVYVFTWWPRIIKDVHVIFEEKLRNYKWESGGSNVIDHYREHKSMHVNILCWLGQMRVRDSLVSQVHEMIMSDKHAMLTDYVAGTRVQVIQFLSKIQIWRGVREPASTSYKTESNVITSDEEVMKQLLL